MGADGTWPRLHDLIDGRLRGSVKPIIAEIAQDAAMKAYRGLFWRRWGSGDPGGSASVLGRDPLNSGLRG
jgi:hypothetical protein